MRLIQNMSTIAEYPTSECPFSRVIKIAVIGGSGVGKTGKLVIITCTTFSYSTNISLYNGYCELISKTVTNGSVFTLGFCSLQRWW